MEEADRIARAKTELEAHKTILIELWGKRYRLHPEYEAAAKEIACKARMPFYVLEDYRVHL